MKMIFCMACLAFPLLISACDVEQSSREPAIAHTAGDTGVTVRCSVQWYEKVEAQLGSDDGRGHGPDIGSQEWKSVVEFKLGVRDQLGVPDRSTDAWCAYVDKLLGRAESASG